MAKALSHTQTPASRPLTQHREPSPSPGDTRPAEHAADWLRHVEAGAIASNSGTTPAQLRALLRNEEVLLGRVRSVGFASPPAYAERR